MNILCISKYASPPNYSKMPARLFILAKEFIKLGHNTTLITSDSNHFSLYPNTENTYNFETVEGVSLCWVKTKKYVKTASLARVLSWFDFERKLFKMDLSKIEKPDVVLISSLSIFTILYGYYLKKKFNSFLVFEIRDIWPLTMTEEGGFSKWHPLVLLIGFIEKFGYKKADLIVGTMPRLDLHVKKILGYEKPFHCSPLGFDPINYQEEIIGNNPFDEVFPKNKVIVGYAGSMGITNALEPLIETIKLLENNEFMIKIQDSGNGIEDVIIDRIFEPYFTTKHKSQGTGLGLSMVEKIIRERYDGKIVVTNEKFILNEKEYFGASFSIYFKENLEG